MEIVDFLPKYPNINKDEEEVLNPYEEGFYESIFKKKEFYPTEKRQIGINGPILSGGCQISKNSTDLNSSHRARCKSCVE